MANKICAVMQPTYIPWLGYFDLIDQVDSFVFLDDVQMEKNSWQLRNRIKTAQGELYLSMSRKKNKGDQLLLIKDTEINDTSRWREKHIKSMETAYRKTEFFEDVFPFIESLINEKTINLSEFNINIIKSIADKIGITTDYHISSKLTDIQGTKDQRVVLICKAIGCNVYLSPKGAAEYIDRKKPGGEFPENNILLFYHEYEHPVYTQLYGEFLPSMSIVDLLFNEGFEKSLGIIRNGRRPPIDYAMYSKNRIKT
jgi:hypothetical protein